MHRVATAATPGPKAEAMLVRADGTTGLRTFLPLVPFDVLLFCTLRGFALLAATRFRNTGMQIADPQNEP
jgi:hypothetical protein